MVLQDFLNCVLTVEEIFEGDPYYYPKLGVKFILMKDSDGRYCFYPVNPLADKNNILPYWAYSRYELLPEGATVDPDPDPESPGKVPVDRYRERLFGVTSFGGYFYYVWFFVTQEEIEGKTAYKLTCVARTLGTGKGNHSQVINGGYNNGRD